MNDKTLVAVHIEGSVQSVQIVLRFEGMIMSFKEVTG